MKVGRSLRSTGASLRRARKTSNHQLTHDDGNVGVAGSDHADTAKVTGVELSRARVVRIHAHQNRPARQADDEDESRRKSSCLVAVRERGEEQHEDERHSVRGNREQLRLMSESRSTARTSTSAHLGIAVSKSFDNSGEESSDTAEAEVQAGV